MARYKAPRMLPRSWEFRLRCGQCLVSGAAHPESVGLQSSAAGTNRGTRVTPAMQCENAAFERLCLAIGKPGMVDEGQAEHRQHRAGWVR